jgi:TolB-like protein
MRGSWCVLGVVSVLLVARSSSGAAAPPAAALMDLEARAGVEKDNADLVTESLLSEIRAARVFSRVVSAGEIQAVLGLEQRKQMMDCRSESCVAEVAASLNVDYIIVGSLGRMGGSYLFNVKVVDARRGHAVASVSDRLAQGTEEAFLDAVKPSVADLVRQMGLKPHTVAAVPTAPRAVASPTSFPSSRPAGVTPERGSAFSPPSAALVVLGGVGLALVPLPLVVAATTALGAALVGQSMLTGTNLVPGLNFYAKVLSVSTLAGTSAMSAVACVSMLATAVVLLLVGAVTTVL